MEGRISSEEDKIEGVVDHVARVLEQWAVERPDLDTSPVGVIGRLHRLAVRLTEELTAVYAAHGLSEGDFDVLATLRRHGRGAALTCGALADSTMVTTGGMSKRIDRLEGAGLVRRRPSTNDGRSRLIELTDAGWQLMDRAFADHIANEHRLVSPLTTEQRGALAELLRTWSDGLDDLEG